MAIQIRNAERTNLLECDFVRNDGELHLSTVAVAASPYAANANSVMLVTTGAGDIVINLPTCALNLGKVYCAKKVDNGAGQVRITPNAADTIDGAASYALVGQYDSATFVSDGNNWWLI